MMIWRWFWRWWSTNLITDPEVIWLSAGCCQDESWRLSPTSFCLRDSKIMGYTCRYLMIIWHYFVSLPRHALRKGTTHPLTDSRTKHYPLSQYVWQDDWCWSRIHLFIVQRHRLNFYQPHSRRFWAEYSSIDMVRGTISPNLFTCLSHIKVWSKSPFPGSSTGQVPFDILYTAWSNLSFLHSNMPIIVPIYTIVLVWNKIQEDSPKPYHRRFPMLVQSGPLNSSF